MERQRLKLTLDTRTGPPHGDDAWGAEVHARVNVKHHFRGDNATKRWIAGRIGKIQGMLQAFSTVIMRGEMTLTITPDDHWFSGELTCYREEYCNERDMWLRQIDIEAHQLCREFGPAIDEIVYTFTQTCEFKPRSA